MVSAWYSKSPGWRSNPRRRRFCVNSKLTSTPLLHFIGLLFVVFSLVSAKRSFAPVLEHLEVLPVGCQIFS